MSIHTQMKQILNYQTYYKDEITTKITNYGLKFIAIMSVPLNIISYFALENSQSILTRTAPVLFSIIVIIVFFFEKKISVHFKLRTFTILLFIAGIYTLVLGLLDMASLWFILSIIFAFFGETKNLSLLIFIISLALTTVTGLLMITDYPYLPIDYGFENCQFACVSIRIINFLIIGFLIFRILKMFFSTINLYIHEIIEKNVVLEQLKTTESKEAEQKLKNQILKSDMEKNELEINYKRKDLNNAFSKIIQFNSLLENIKKDITNKNYKEALLNATLGQSKNYHFDNFLIHFKELYPDFTQKLSETYKQLTETEIKLIVMLSSGLKSSEMAQMLNVTEATIGKYRNRIRKKLNIDSNTDIASYLLENLSSNK